MAPPQASKKIGIFLFPEIEVLDFAGPFEVFSVARQFENNPFKVFTFAETTKPIKIIGGLMVLPTYSLETVPEVDLLVLPGGSGSKRAAKNKRVVEQLRSMSLGSALTMSICSGLRLLAKTGLLKDEAVVTHQGVYEEIAKTNPQLKLNRTARFLQNGKFITTGGISAGIDAAFYVVRQWVGEKAAQQTQREMEYGNWRAIKK